MSLVEYAQSEMELAGVEQDVRPSLMAAIEAFAAYGHSGGSALVCIDILNRLLRYMPLTPLTGEDDEWTLVAGDCTCTDGSAIWQNKRLSSVFKDADGFAYDIDAVLHQYPNGDIVNRAVHHGIEFPYMPGQPVIIQLMSEDD